MKYGGRQPLATLITPMRASPNNQSRTKALAWTDPPSSGGKSSRNRKPQRLASVSESVARVPFFRVTPMRPLWVVKVFVASRYVLRPNSYLAALRVFSREPLLNSQWAKAIFMLEQHVTAWEVRRRFDGFVHRPRHARRSRSIATRPKVCRSASDVSPLRNASFQVATKSSSSRPSSRWRVPKASGARARRRD